MTNGGDAKPSGHNGKRKRGKDRSKHNGSGKQAKPGRKSFTRKEPCKHCDKMHAVPNSKCWTLDKNAAKKPKKFNPKGGAKNKKAFQMTWSSSVA